MKVKLDVKLFNEENTRRSECHGVCVMRSDAKCVCEPSSDCDHGGCCFDDGACAMGLGWGCLF